MVEQPGSKPYVDAPLLAGLDTFDHWSNTAAAIRLEILAKELPFDLPSNPRFTGGASNDVWDLGDTFLKVCWRADRDRILRDARVNQALPKEIPHALVHDVGRTANFSWVLSARVPGVAFSDLSADLSESAARDLMSQIAEILASLHSWLPDSSVRQVLQARPALDGTNPLSLWASDLITLPTSLAVAQADLAKGLPFVDPSLIDEAIDLIVSLSDVDPFNNPHDEFVVLHGDPSFGNWFVDDGHVTGLMDFERTRLGPRDLDLVTLVFVCQLDDDEETTIPRYPYLKWLEADYPQLFAAVDLARRLWLYELIFFLRGIIWWPPDMPESTLAPQHHVHALRRLLEGPLPR
jgi:aminoglycoside phosphotransferase (APT) family kinase protein